MVSKRAVRWLGDGPVGWRRSRQVSAAAVLGPAGLIVVALGLGACSSGAEDGNDLPAGVVLRAVPDLSGEPDTVRFTAAPDLLVTNDGRVIYGAREEDAIQGELLVDVRVHTMTANGVDAVVAASEEGAAPANISELMVLVGSELGTPSFYLPDRYRFAAIALGPVAEHEGLEGPVVQWPESASISLADASGCTTLPELEVGEAFETAADGSWFVDDGVLYGVIAAPDWPGAPCELPD